MLWYYLFNAQPIPLFFWCFNLSSSHGLPSWFFSTVPFRQFAKIWISCLFSVLSEGAPNTTRSTGSTQSRPRWPTLLSSKKAQHVHQQHAVSRMFAKRTDPQAPLPRGNPHTSLQLCHKLATSQAYTARSQAHYLSKAFARRGSRTLPQIQH